MSDVRTPAVFMPPCSICDQVSKGGVVLEMEENCPAGSPVMTVEFYCAECTPGSFAVMSDRLFPAYRILHAYNVSRFKVQRLSRAAQAERLQE